MDFDQEKYIKKWSVSFGAEAVLWICPKTDRPYVSYRIFENVGRNSFKMSSIMDCCSRSQLDITSVCPHTGDFAKMLAIGLLLIKSWKAGCWR